MMPKRAKTTARREARGDGGATDARTPAQAAAEDVQKLLDERGRSYGDFAHQAATAQALKDILRTAPGWGSMPADMREALDMSMVKVSRIVCGDPAHPDSWLDLVGYASLVSNRL